MATPRMKIARLDEVSLNKLKQMEEALGAVIVAFETSYPLAELSDEQVNKLQQLEQELGVTLIAYQH
jgi:hypothetical protein